MDSMSVNDRDKITELISDECLTENCEALIDFFDRCSLVFWSRYHDQHSCSFCCSPAVYHNEYALLPVSGLLLGLYACDSCMYDLENGEVDIINHDDHPLSLELYHIICDWINKNYWVDTDAESYFDTHNITYNRCDICHEIIYDDHGQSIALAHDGLFVAHKQCAVSKGFAYDSATLSSILDDLNLSDLTYFLQKTPDYTPPLSQENIRILSDCVEHNLPTFDFSDAHRIISQYNPKFWQPSIRRTRCTFCDNSATLHNEDLHVDSCDTCITFIPNVNARTPHSSQCLLFRDRLSQWLNTKFCVRIKAQTLFDTCGQWALNYHRCMVCKKVIELDRDVAVTTAYIAHGDCFAQSNSHSHGYLSLDSILNLPNFHLDSVAATLRQ